MGEAGEEIGLFSGTISGDFAEAPARGGGMFRTRALYRLLGGPPAPREHKCCMIRIHHLRAVFTEDLGQK